MGKEAKTNAMRILDKNKIPYEMNTYTCDEFIDGCHIADQLGQPYERSFKTLVTVGKSKNYSCLLSRMQQNGRKFRPDQHHLHEYHTVPRTVP